jgi:hypothetical protein
MLSHGKLASGASVGRVTCEGYVIRTFKFEAPGYSYVLMKNTSWSDTVLTVAGSSVTTAVYRFCPSAQSIL